MAKKKDAQYPDHGLDPKELIFAEAYILSQNATEAAKTAGYSENFAHMAGHRIKNRPHVREYIEKRLDCVLSDLRMSVDEIIAELQARAMFDVSELYEDDGSVKRVNDMSPLARRMVKKLKCIELFEGNGADKHAIGLIKDVDIQGQEKAFEMMLKFHGLLKERVSHENPDGSALTPPRIEIVIRDANEE